MKTTTPRDERCRTGCSPVEAQGTRCAGRNPGKDLKALSDQRLLRELGRLRSTERKTLLEILLYLIEIDRRRLYLPLGYGSLFEFCRGRLRYSESSAGRRIAVARCMRDFPRVYRLLASGGASFGAIARVARVITPGNAEELLVQIEGRSEREVDVLVSRYRPQGSITERVRPVWVETELSVAGTCEAAGLTRDESFLAGENFTPSAGSGKFPSSSQRIHNQADTDLPTAKSMPQTWQSTVVDVSGQGGCGARGGCAGPPVRGAGEVGARGGCAGPPVRGAGEVGARGACAGLPVRGAGVVRVLEQRFKIEFGVDPEFLEKLERVRALLSGKYHGRLELERLFGVLLDEYIERHSPQGRIAARLRRRAARDEAARDKAARDEAAREKAAQEQKTVREKTAQDITAGRDRAARKIDSRRKEVAELRKPAAPAKNTGPENKLEGGNPPALTTDPAKVAGVKRKNPRHIPRVVRDGVWARDRGRCTFVSPGGRRCGSRWDIEIDHIVPVARGGKNTPDNLRLLCSRHNRLEAERAFGEEHMARFRGSCDRGS